MLWRDQKYPLLHAQHTPVRLIKRNHFRTNTLHFLYILFLFFFIKDIISKLFLRMCAACARNKVHHHVRVTLLLLHTKITHNKNTLCSSSSSRQGNACTTKIQRRAITGCCTCTMHTTHLNTHTHLVVVEKTNYKLITI